MKKYKFDLQQSTIRNFTEKDHIIEAYTLTGALEKFARKHDLELPAYWDEPHFDKNIELIFKGSPLGEVKYYISW